MSERAFSFVSPPYATCPECGAKEFGRLWVNDRSYVRKCDACRHTERFDLPDIRKAKVYLDQFAISGMMKALNPRDPGHDAARADGWLDLFERLDRLSKLQLVVCPESRAHEVESLLYAPGFAELRRLYEHLSHGVSFRDPDQILGRQVYRHAVDWIAGSVDGPLDLPEHDAVDGKPHAWTDTLQIGVRFPVDDEEVEALRLRRETGAEALEPVFSRWQAERDLRFEDWYAEELEAWPQFVWSDFLRSTGRLLAGLQGLRELDAEDVFPNTRSRELVYVLVDTFQKAGVPEEDALDRVLDFLFSGTLGRVARLRISSLLWAGIAHQAAHGGRRRPPNRGMMTDVGTVSSVLPYCDAILVDGEVRGMLEMGQVRDRLGFETLVFSKSTIGGLLDFLDGLERDAPGDVIEVAVALYGEPEAYMTILESPPR